MIKEIEELEEFLICDMPSKIFPLDEILKKITGEESYRQDPFMNEKEVEEYLQEHFKILKEQINNRGNEGLKT